MTQERQTYGVENGEPVPWSSSDVHDGQRVVQQYYQQPDKNSLEESMKWAVRSLLFGPGLSLALIIGFIVLFLIFAQTEAGSDIYSSGFNMMAGFAHIVIALAAIATISGLVLAVLGIMAFISDYKAGVSRPFAIVLLTVTVLWALITLTTVFGPFLTNLA